MRKQLVTATVEFIDVYDGQEHQRTEQIKVQPPEAGQDLDEWGDNEIRPHTGDGNATHDAAGYFAEITACDDHPELVGRTFEWGT
jgi:hypothetical protein